MPPKGSKRKQDTNITDTDSPIPKKSSNLSPNTGIDDRLELLLKDKEWKAALSPEMEKDYFKELEMAVKKDIQSGVEVFPPKELIFNAFNLTSLSSVKVVLLGQDPYHDNGQAMGLAFSVPHDIKTPPSLRNMYKELTSDIMGFKDPGHGCLEKWAKQGVLLLNATLTVQAHKPNSHSKLGWQTFTDNTIKLISEKCSGVVFMLWGNFAHKKQKFVDENKHSILKDAHPSPLSFGKFKDCKCFSRANEELKRFGKTEIDWKL